MLVVDAPQNAKERKSRRRGFSGASSLARTGADVLCNNNANVANKSYRPLHTCKKPCLYEGLRCAHAEGG